MGDDGNAVGLYFRLLILAFSMQATAGGTDW